MILELDLGNSRIKWRLLSDSGAAKFGTASYREGLAAVLNKHLDKTGTDLPDKGLAGIRVASVVDGARRDEVLRQCRPYCLREPQLARVLPQCAGVTQGYNDISHLGVDRWLALLSAHRQVTGECVVVSCGTAMTVDLLSASGVHRGGYIVPGLETMRLALADRTHSVKVGGIEPVDELSPGRDTAPAVHRGLLLMLVSLIDNARGQLRTRGEEVPVIMSGGDVEFLIPHLRGRVVVKEQLVLDGLALALA